MRAAKEYLRSGEAEDIVVSGNIGYKIVQDPQYNGMFQRITNGVTSLYRAKNQDVEWSDTDSTDVAMTTTAAELLSVTTSGYSIGAGDDATFTISGMVTNANAQNQTLYIVVKDDGTQIGSTIEVPMLKQESDKIFAVSRDIGVDIAQDSVITVEFYASTGSGVTLNGTQVNTKINIILPRAAPVTRFVQASGNLGASISRGEIEGSIVSANMDMPRDLDIYYIADDAGNCWECVYLEKIDKYGVKKLNLK